MPGRLCWSGAGAAAVGGARCRCGETGPGTATEPQRRARMPGRARPGTGAGAAVGRGAAPGRRTGRGCRARDGCGCRAATCGAATFSAGTSAARRCRSGAAVRARGAGAVRRRGWARYQCRRAGHGCHGPGRRARGESRRGGRGISGGRVPARCPRGACPGRGCGAGAGLGAVPVPASRARMPRAGAEGRRRVAARGPRDQRRTSSSSVSSRSLPRARETADLTVPTETPSTSAVCTSLRSS